MRSSQPDQQLEEPEQVSIGIEQAPVNPADLIVLAVGVVVTTLCPPELVAGQDHGGAGGEQENRREVPHLPPAQSIDFLRVGRSLAATVPAQVVVAAVGVPLAVGFIVLAVVGDQISQCESIVTGDEVQTLIRPPATGLIEI